MSEGPGRRPADEKRDFVAAAQAARVTLGRAAAVRPELSARDHRVLEAVIAETALWSLVEKRLYLARIAAHAFGVEQVVAWQLKKTAASLRKLTQAGVIEAVPPRGRPLSPAYVVRLPDVAVADPEAGPAQQTPLRDPQDAADPVAGPADEGSGGPADPASGLPHTPDRVHSGSRNGTPSGDSLGDPGGERARPLALEELPAALLVSAARSEHVAEVRDHLATLAAQHGREATEELANGVLAAGGPARFLSDLKPRLAQQLQQLAGRPRPCDRCSAPTDPTELYNVTADGTKWHCNDCREAVLFDEPMAATG